MRTYIYMIFIIGLICLFYKFNEDAYDKKSNFLAFLIASVLIAVSGLRYYVGADYLAYRYNYYNYVDEEFSLTGQYGLTIIAKIANFINNDYATWFFLMALFTISLAVIAIKKYSVSFTMSILLYIFLGCWSLGFNVVKQTAAASVLFIGYSYLRDRKFISWCVICILATAFHTSAILMIPLYFLVSEKFSYKRCLFIIACGFIISLNYDRLFVIMDTILRGRENVLQTEIRGESVNIIRILVNISPTVLWFINRKQYDYTDKSFNTLLYISIFNAVLCVSTMNSIYLTRFTSYTIIFDALFIPYLLKPFDGRLRALISIPLLTLYMIFWLYLLYKGSTTRYFHWIFERL